MRLKRWEIAALGKAAQLSFIRATLFPLFLYWLSLEESFLWKIL